MRQFLGLTSYFRRYIEHYAHTAIPLTRLTKTTPKGQPLQWDRDCDIAFDTLRERLMTPPVLRPPDNQRPYYIVADASQYALGAVLMQRYQDDHGHDIDHPVCYASRQMDVHEINYPQWEREVLALIFALQK